MAERPWLLARALAWLVLALMAGRRSTEVREEAEPPSIGALPFGRSRVPASIASPLTETGSAETFGVG